MSDRNRADIVTTAARLHADGVSRGQVDTELRARRWRRDGHCIVLHNGPLSPAQRREMARLHAGPNAIFTAFTAAELVGLTGWERTEVHLLAPAGTRLRKGCPVPTRLHLHGPGRIEREHGLAIERREAALLRAAATFPRPRPACGLLAAAVQQRITTADALAASLHGRPRLRHRAVLLAALTDIAGGSQSLAEIDFVALCRRHGLPAPVQQSIRTDPQGRRRYLDAQWRRADGRLVIVEIDGALHLAAERWWADQTRQNEFAIDDAIVLRFPSVILRTDEAQVADQLRRALYP